jgi:hypothetical protein
MYVSAKLIPVATTLGIRGGGMEERGEEGKFKYDRLDTL